MNKFIGRESEKTQLKAIIELNRPSIAVIYGRRRVGKSELINEATRGKNVLSFEGIEGQSKQKQIKNFIFQLKNQTEISGTNISDWSEALILLREPTESGQWIIVFDEFQWMANYQSELVSVVKMIWEQYLTKNRNITLILCGSIASFMKSKVLKSSALYGRSDYELNLRELRLHEMKKFFPNKGAEEVLETAMLVGGIPKYLELVSEYPSVYDAIEHLAFTENGYFTTEYDRLFASHFGKNLIFKKIVQTLTNNPYGLSVSKLASLLDIKPGGTLSRHLDDLESAGFLHSMVPFDKPSNSKLRKYHLVDAYIRFFTCMMKSTNGSIASPGASFHMLMATPRFNSWMGRSFEYLCIRHHIEISKILGFNGVPYRVGPFFQRKTLNEPGVQIDLLFERSDKVFVLCEMKYLLNKVPGDIISQVERKVEVLQQKYPDRTILKVLLTKSSSVEAVSKSGYFFRIIKAMELMSHTE